MFKRILTFVVLQLSLSFVVSVSWAAEVSLYNGNFERLKGKPTPYEVEFSANEGQGRLVLLNGTLEADFRVSSATISLNGTVIVDSEAFNQKIPNLTVDIPLAAHNVLVVQLVSAPESFIDIAITQVADAVAFVDESGGNIAVVDSSSLLEGVSLEIPPNALTESALISIEAAEAPPEAPERGAFAGESIELKPNGLTFEKPSTLTVPYNDVNNDGIVDGTSIDEEFVSVGYFNETSHLWVQLKIVSRDPLNNTVSAEIEHFLIYSPFVRTDNIIPQSTQKPPVNIEINGNPVEWAGNDINGNPITPTMSVSDPIDSMCGTGTEIRDVYTAMDNSYAYIMINMEDGVDPNAEFRLEVDIREGKDHVSDSYADLQLNLGEDSVYVHNLSGDIGFYCSNAPEDSNFYCSVTPDPYDSSFPPGSFFNVGNDIKIVSFEALEARIPLYLFKSTKTFLEPDYFNATGINLNKTENNTEITCDVDEMYPKIPWFKFQKRLFADKTDRVTFIFAKTTREGRFLNDTGDIGSVVITKPDSTEINLTGDDLIASPQSSAWGRYVSGNKSFGYAPYLDETYFLKTFLKENDSYNEVLQTGEYRLKLTDIDGHIYEDDFEVTRTEDIPSVDSNAVQCHIHIDGDDHENELFNSLASQGNIVISGGDLYCDWEYPAYVGNPDFQPDVEEAIQTHPHLRAYINDTMLRYVYPTSMRGGIDPNLLNINPNPLDIIDFVIVPAANLNELVDGANKLTISIRTRVRSGSVRSYSAEKEIYIPGL